MKLISRIYKLTRIKLGIIKDLFAFLWKQKLWWAIPLILILITITSFLIAAGHTGIAAFIYPLF